MTVLSLTTTNHDRDVAGLRYIYPVMSRRAGGLSIGINVNTNNACNWRCLYCQVPDLKRGAAPTLDLPLLEEELRWFLQSVLNGNFYTLFNVPLAQQMIKDIALSGNGEPTSVKEFPELLSLLARVVAEFGLTESINKVLITNGSLLQKASVQQGLRLWHEIGGEVWFKLDSATKVGRQLLNNSPLSNRQVEQNLASALSLCRTKIQTCLLRYAGVACSADELSAYLNFVAPLRNNANLRSIMLYTLARPSLQPEAPKLKALSLAEMHVIAAEVKALGFEVSVSV